MNAPRIPMADHGSTAAGGPGLRANGDTQSGAQGQTPFLTCSMCTENFMNEQELEAHIQSSDPCSDCIHEALSKAECNGLRDEGQTQLTHASADENHSTSSMSPSSVKHESKTVGFAPKPFSDEPKSQGVPTRNVPFEDIDQVVQCLSEVDKAVRDYCLYVQKQQQSGKPLYKWAKCDEYKIIRRKAQDLSESLSKLQQYSSLPKDFTATLLEARRYSTSTSRAIGDVLAIINKKTESFVFEQQNFIMSEEDKAIANTLITSEVQQVLEHCSLASERVWAAIDRLQGLHGTAEPKSKTKQSWKSKLASICISAVVSAYIGLVTSYMTSSHYPNIAFQNSGEAASYAQVLEMVKLNHAYTNITSQIHTKMLHEMERRHEDLSAVTEAHQSRIDNLVESLGPPNELGLYFTSTSSSGEGTRNPTDATDLLHLQRDLKNLRNNINRMDMRLTADVHKLRKQRK